MKKRIQNNFIDKLISILKSILGNNPNEFKVVVLSIFGATTFWFLNQLNKDYTTIIQYPIEFNFDKNQFTSIQDLPQYVDLSVEAKGWDLFAEKLKKQEPIAFELENKVKKSVIKNWQIENLFKDLNRKILVKQVLNDEIVVNIDEKISRQISFYIDPKTILLKNNLILVGQPKIEPAQMQIIGAKSTLNEIKDSVLIPINRILDEDFATSITTSIFNWENIQFDKKQFKVTINTSKIISTTTEIPLNLNFKDSLGKLNKPTIAVNYRIAEEIPAQELYENIKFSFTIINDTSILVKIASFPTEFINVQLIDSTVSIQRVL